MVEGLHPISSEQKAPIEVKITAVIAINFGTYSYENLWPVEPFSDPVQLHVAKRSAICALLANIIRILPRLLIRTNHGVVAIDRGR